MKKFDLYNTLEDLGFEKKTDNFGFMVLSKDYKKIVDVVFGGQYESKLIVEVRFSDDKKVATASYYDGLRRMLKQKVHLSEKRAYNAIKQTIYNKGFEI